MPNELGRAGCSGVREALLNQVWLLEWGTCGPALVPAGSRAASGVLWGSAPSTGILQGPGCFQQLRGRHYLISWLKAAWEAHPASLLARTSRRGPEAPSAAKQRHEGQAGARCRPGSCGAPGSPPCPSGRGCLAEGHLQNFVTSFSAAKTSPGAGAGAASSSRRCTGNKPPVTKAVCVELLNLAALGCTRGALPFLPGPALPVAPLPGQREGAEAFLSAPAFACQEVPGSSEALLARCVCESLGFRRAEDPFFPGDAPRWRGLSVLGRSSTQRPVVRGQLGWSGEAKSDTTWGAPPSFSVAAQPPGPQSCLIFSVSSRYNWAGAKKAAREHHVGLSEDGGNPSVSNTASRAPLQRSHHGQCQPAPSSPQKQGKPSQRRLLPVVSQANREDWNPITSSCPPESLRVRGELPGRGQPWRRALPQTPHMHPADVLLSLAAWKLQHRFLPALLG